MMRKGVAGMTAKPNYVWDRFNGIHIGYTPERIMVEGRGGAVEYVPDSGMCSMSDVGDATEQVCRCSKCGEEYCMSDFQKFPWRFCPMCGARVVEKEEDE